MNQGDVVARGGCACGNVRYEATAELRLVTDCHCEPCRRWTGHHMAATSVASGHLKISGDSLRWWDSTPTVQYGFCGDCGSSLFWRAADKPHGISITAGSLDPPTGLSTNLTLFSSEHGDYHRPDPAVEAAPHDR